MAGMMRYHQSQNCMETELNTQTQLDIRVENIAIHDHCRVYTCNLVSGTIEFNHAIDLFKTHALPSLEAMCSAVHTRHFTRIPLRLDVKQEVKKDNPQNHRTEQVQHSD